MLQVDKRPNKLTLGLEAGTLYQIKSGLLDVQLFFFSFSPDQSAIL